MTKFFETLQIATSEEREQLLSLPIIHACFQGNVSKVSYVAFLQEAFHHVKHTVPLMMASGAKLSFEKEWIRAAIVEYIEEEYGHHEWILNDIEACGGDKKKVRMSQASPAISDMLNYLYEAIEATNPLCIFGMVWVLEGTSVALASQAAVSMAQGLSLPKSAFTYLESHGSLDKEHMTFFEALMNKITDPKDQRDIIESAKVVYRLYSQMLASLPQDTLSKTALSKTALSKTALSKTTRPKTTLAKTALSKTTRPKTTEPKAKSQSPSFNQMNSAA